MMETLAVGDVVSVAYQHLQVGDDSRALELLAVAVACAPDIALIQYLMGIGLLRQKQQNAGIAHLKQAVVLDEANADYQLALGHALMAEQADEALPHLARAIQLGSRDPSAYQKLAALLVNQGKPEEALHICDAGFGVCGFQQPGILNSLALALKGIGRYADALGCMRAAEALEPNDATTLINLAAVFFELGQLEEARHYCERACAIDPDNASAHFNLGVALLAQGNFKDGFREFEARLKLPKIAATIGRFQQPRWDGSELQGRRILLETEQGVGDAIQFVRYERFVKERGGQVVLRITSSLARLFRWLEGCEIASSVSLPPFDVHCAMMSLPLLAGTERDNIPPPAKFTIPEDMKVKWQQLLGPKNGLRVGIVWAGSPKHANDRNRSLSLRLLTPLFAISQVAWFSLQVGPAAEQIQEMGANQFVRDLAPLLTDYAETAGAISQLDLVISADTSVAHLAGSVGNAVWILVPFVADWRWIPEQGRTSWYPNARIFRQVTAGDWPTVVHQVAEALLTQAAKR
jgi:tetratricopeptide (TPR) repeat protein